MIAILKKTMAVRLVRHSAVALLDGCIVAASLAGAVYLRMNGVLPDRMAEGLAFSLPVFTLVSLAVFHAVGLYRRVWRYVSVPDLIFVIEAATLAIIGSLTTLLVLGKVNWMPASVPVIQWFILVVALGGARMARRVLSEYRRGRIRTTRQNLGGRTGAPALIVGAGERVEMLLRMIDATPDAGYRPIGILEDAGLDLRLNMHGVPILGSTDALEDVVKQLEAEGRRPEVVIVAETAERLTGDRMVQLVARAESLGLGVASMGKPAAQLAHAGKGELDLQIINLADLLGRPQLNLDSDVVARAVAGRRVLITGAGGTIGRELTRQIASFGPSELIMLDAGEFNLYEVDMEMAENYPALKRTPVLCSIRQRQPVMQLFEEHRPELVFHAAALKHVPLVEQNPCAGVMTNVLGTRNIADAAKIYKVRAFVQVSTDKAVNPVGVMGATKRLGELYAQALDLEGVGNPEAPRFMTVRFGNVLGSSGSLIPLFQRQLARRGPLTVTHPEIRRYFMTVHEAVQLILQSTARALEGDVRRGRIFVLDMGEPIKIIEIAKRMIRLAGLRPDHDVKIEIVGLRPGEKLYEELFDEAETRLPSKLPGIFEAEPNPVALPKLHNAFDELAMAATRGDADGSKTIIAELLEAAKKPSGIGEIETVHLTRPTAVPDGGTLQPAPAQGTLH